ncbi:hypothetical protein EDD37DRAFT_218063 [Exophiala viscosa]|uniref:uncharacterized protein n=1 Tax=Exophiala viscosa TaxID=2486360 RepID=UPI00219DB191|nr:hypothetical protein EDD37DRAFT_218063 [Exophiala viscosa]
MPVPVKSAPPQRADDIDPKATCSISRQGAGKSLQHFSAGKHRTRLPAPPSLAQHATSKTVKQPNVPTTPATGPGIPRARSIVAHTGARIAANRSAGVASSGTLTTQVPSKGDAQNTKPDPQQRLLMPFTRASFEPRAQNDRLAKPAPPRAGSHARAPPSVAAPLLEKPAFNTYDKHYSPKKINNRSAGSPTLAIPHVTTNGQQGSRSIEPSRNAKRLFVDELLQLSLVHDKAGPTLRGYEASITVQLDAAAVAITRDIARLVDLERARQSHVNAEAVIRWIGPVDVLSTVQKGEGRLLAVAHCVKELNETVQEDGPLQKVMQEFVQWHVLVSSKGKNRDVFDGKQEKTLSAAPMNSSWAALVDSIQAKVTACRDLLAEVQEASSDESSMGRLITMHHRPAAQILQAIDTCRTVEGLILRREMDWMQTSLTNAIDEAERHDFAPEYPKCDRTGVWNTFTFG